MRNENLRLNTEMDEAETRILRDCMEAQGFTEHDTDEFPHTYASEWVTLIGDPFYEQFLPTVEEAERRGFWIWADLPDAEDIEEETHAWQEEMRGLLERAGEVSAE